MTNSEVSNIDTQSFDAIILGAGGAGLRAALQLSKAKLNTAVVSKVFPTRSHTVAAQGGINAALANISADKWQWHMYDTIKGSDYLGDQDAIEFMCQEAARSVVELEHFGIPFSRTSEGKIYQRPFGGQSQEYGGIQAARTCAVADRTGHAILHTLYQQNIKEKTNFFNEYFALDILYDDNGKIGGLFVINMHTGSKLIMKSRCIMIATGGSGQLYRTNSNAIINTGDGLGMVLRKGIPLQDMEFFQFHPTGLAGKGILITEGTRGEGGFLVNSDGERFMERYAPNVKDLASRDVVSRAIYTEVKEGRGCGPNKDYILLQLHHLPKETIAKRLPGIRQTSITFMGVDPVQESIPVYPTAHYMMGGIPTNFYGQVLEHDNKVVAGLYAMGECACVSVHGANRLGGNSLLDLVVFGRAAANHMLEEISFNNEFKSQAANLDVESANQRIDRWLQPNISNPTKDNVSVLKKKLQTIMEDGVGVFRSDKLMGEAITKLDAIKLEIDNAVIGDNSPVFNFELFQALELENLLALAFATVYSAYTRKESRGAHSHFEFQGRDDVNWLKHTMYCAENGGHKHKIFFKEVNFKPKTIDAFPPKERVY